MKTLNFCTEKIEQIMTDTTFADRLNLALDKEGFPPKNKGRIQLLAEMVGLTHRGASKWVNGESSPPAKKYANLAYKLNVREEWLKHGLGAMLEDNVNLDPNLQDKSTMSVPIYNFGDFFSPTKSSIQTIDCNLPSVGTLFGIVLETEAMSPRFPTGSIVIFDDNKPIADGDFVLVNFDNYPAPIFRQLLIVGSAMYLNAHNPKFERLSLSDQNQILGVMIQAILSFI